MKLLITLLTNHDLPRLKRLVKSVQLQYHENFLNVDTYIVVNTLNDDYYQSVLNANFPFKVIKTESNGKPGKGKNSCMEIFANGDWDFVTVMDGDDFFYPTFLRVIANHLKHYPSLDVLGKIPCDFISKYEPNGGYKFNFIQNDIKYWGSVWGISICHGRFGRPYGPGKGRWVDEDLPSNSDKAILLNKKAVESRMHEDIGNGEDHLYSMQLLNRHQKGELRYFQSMSSDMFVQDRSLDNNIQKKFPQELEVNIMKERMFDYVDVNRSNLDELPIIFKELLLGQYKKEEYIKDLHKTCIIS
tara:strand:+ start:3579 stop:4481 length:903 start_codon:yes stop_codon:yes gene_type:complete